MSSAKKQLKKDHAFEFAAPQFHDFTSNVDTDPNADVWFGNEEISPLVEVLTIPPRPPPPENRPPPCHKCPRGLLRPAAAAAAEQGGGGRGGGRAHGTVFSAAKATPIQASQRQADHDAVQRLQQDHGPLCHDWGDALVHGTDVVQQEAETRAGGRVRKLQQRPTRRQQQQVQDIDNRQVAQPDDPCPCGYKVCNGNRKRN